ncbi:NADPH-dependent FMN reductase [Nocardioides jishulii]|uniref:NAD(P)H-dependent oxidoreductase n=1 Tax=Nocardioides jishulii TaxID=2575440 RepID=A0A4U2YIP4_9ACTN|nr:NAD(P)H-dependent oxidoreductase [Nocardioides jishulii]QCX26695.1 NAD(P)H-dependent oxidoreductase [Nocardioides jishulii]TKI60335.1 NAD(P)H-dependent oxidoreductase [Nocardioides jishulii]
MKIAVIVGSTRPQRRGSGVGAWIMTQAQEHPGAEFTLLEVADFDLTATYEQRTDKSYEEPTTQRWSDVVDAFDGYVFVTPEYNHGLPAPFKNAVDLLYAEWSGKAVALVGYGTLGAARSVEQWRGVVANLGLVGVGQAVHLQTAEDFDGDELRPPARRVDDTASVLRQLLALTAKLRS